MSLSGEVHNCVDFFDIEDIAHQIRGADIALYKLIVRIILYLVEVF